jgi:hypothetical protein
LRRRVVRQHDGHDPLVIGPERFEHLDAGAAGHVDIEHQHVGPRRLDGVPGLRRAPRGVHMLDTLEGREYLHETVANHSRIINDQNLHRAPP